MTRMRVVNPKIEYQQNTRDWEARETVRLYVIRRASMGRRCHFDLANYGTPERGPRISFDEKQASLRNRVRSKSVCASGLCECHGQSRATHLVERNQASL